MIYKTALFLTGTLNDFLKNKFSVQENMVVLNSIMHTDGTVPQENQNKIVCSLVSIETDTKMRQAIPHGRENIPGARQEAHSISYFLLSANFDVYAEAMHYFDTVIAFFQERPVFNAASSTGFPAELTDLRVEFYAVSLEDVCSIYDSLGLKGQPAVILKVRSAI